MDTIPLGTPAQLVVDCAGPASLGPVRTDAQGSFQVMRDPEGNEFCLVSNDQSALSSPYGD